MDIWHDFPGPNVAYILELYERYRQDPASVDPATRAYFPPNCPDGNGPVAQPSMRGPNGLVAQVPAVAEGAPSLERGAAAQAPVSAMPTRTPEGAVDAIARATRLARAIRSWGHLAAHLDPLGTPPPGAPELELSYDGITEADLEGLPASLVGGPCAENAANAREAVERLRGVYCATTGYDFGQINDPGERA